MLNILIESHKSTAHTRIGWLRSVSTIHHAFAIYSMMDEIAEARGMDPIENALELLGEDRDLIFEGEMEGDFKKKYGEKLDDFPWNPGRMKKVIEELAQKLNWKAHRDSGKAIGFAAHKSFLTYVAFVVLVEKDANGKLSIPEVH